MNTDKSFFGHPIGLRTLFLTEMWERMSYYGMRALLVLYMTGSITGFNPGMGMSAIDANAIYGIYVGFVYFMVVPGGWIADNILGHQKAVLIGAIIIALGHFTLAIPLEQTFFLGLILSYSISLFISDKYKSETILVIQSSYGNNPSNLASNYGNLAGLAGIDLSVNGSDKSLEGIELMNSVSPQKLKRRFDQVSDGDQQDRVLSNAPDAREGFFAVPKVVE